MNTATIKTKVQSSVKPSGRKVKAPTSKKRGRNKGSSLWKTIIIFLTFAGLVAYMFSPNVPDPQMSGSQAPANSGFASGLAR